MLSVARLNQLKEFEQLLGYVFQDRDLLNQALTHKSYSKEVRNGSPLDNERLEFLGDAVLKIVVSTYLYNKFPEQHEGYLTKMRASVISDATLAEVGNKQNLGKYMLLSNNEIANGGAQRKSNVANAMEGLFGACYLDGGLKQAERIVLGFMEPVIKEVTTSDQNYDYKSLLQEQVQGLGWKLPEYRVIQENGPEHDKIFKIQVRVGKGLKKFKEEGLGHTKKEAEQQSAKKVLELFANSTVGS